MDAQAVGRHASWPLLHELEQFPRGALGTAEGRSRVAGIAVVAVHLVDHELRELEPLALAGVLGDAEQLQLAHAVLVAEAER